MIYTRKSPSKFSTNHNTFSKSSPIIIFIMIIFFFTVLKPITCFLVEFAYLILTKGTWKNEDKLKLISFITPPETNTKKNYGINFESVLPNTTQYNNLITNNQQPTKSKL